MNRLSVVLFGVIAVGGVFFSSGCGSTTTVTVTASPAIASSSASPTAVATAITLSGGVAGVFKVTSVSCGSHNFANNIEVNGTVPGLSYPYQIYVSRQGSGASVGLDSNGSSGLIDGAPNWDSPANVAGVSGFDVNHGAVLGDVVLPGSDSQATTLGPVHLTGVIVCP